LQKIIPASNQKNKKEFVTNLKTSSFRTWNPGTMEQWNNGTMEQWNNGTLEQWNNGTMEQWNYLESFTSTTP
jgi:hypothetical protein